MPQKQQITNICIKTTENAIILRDAFISIHSLGSNTREKKMGKKQKTKFVMRIGYIGYIHMNSIV